MMIRIYKIMQFIKHYFIMLYMKLRYKDLKMLPPPTLVNIPFINWGDVVKLPDILTICSYKPVEIFKPVKDNSFCLTLTKDLNRAKFFDDTIFVIEPCDKITDRGFFIVLSEEGQATLRMALIKDDEIYFRAIVWPEAYDRYTFPTKKEKNERIMGRLVYANFPPTFDIVDI